MADRPHSWEFRMDCEVSSYDQKDPVMVRKGSVLEESPLEFQLQMLAGDISLKYKDRHVVVGDWIVKDLGPIDQTSPA